MILRLLWNVHFLSGNTRCLKNLLYYIFMWPLSPSVTVIFLLFNLLFTSYQSSAVSVHCVNIGIGIHVCTCMNIWLCVLLSVHMCTYVRTQVLWYVQRVHECMCTHMYVYMCMCMCTYLYTCLCVHVYISVYTCMFVCLCMCVYVHAWV